MIPTAYRHDYNYDDGCVINNPGASTAARHSWPATLETAACTRTASAFPATRDPGFKTMAVSNEGDIAAHLDVRHHCRRLAMLAPALVSNKSTCLRDRRIILATTNMSARNLQDGSAPLTLHTCTSNRSLENIKRSISRAEAPYPMRQSRSISPRRSPPSRDLPSVGCLVNTARGPRDRACILSLTCSIDQCGLSSPSRTVQMGDGMRVLPCVSASGRKSGRRKCRQKDLRQ